jgi:hypothetical protein
VSAHHHHDQQTPPRPRGARALGGAGGAQARSAEHRRGVGIHATLRIFAVTISAGRSSETGTAGAGGGTPPGCPPSENAGGLGMRTGSSRRAASVKRNVQQLRWPVRLPTAPSWTTDLEALRGAKRNFRRGIENQLVGRFHEIT